MHWEKLKQKILSEQSEFISYVDKLINTNRFEDGETLGISILAIKSGPERLSDEQWHILIENGLKTYNYVDKCESCTDDIQWSDMYSAIYINRDHLCPFCNYLENKK